MYPDPNWKEENKSPVWKEDKALYDTVEHQLSDLETNLSQDYNELAGILRASGDKSQTNVETVYSDDEMGAANLDDDLADIFAAKKKTRDPPVKDELKAVFAGRKIKQLEGSIFGQRRPSKSKR